jgi:dTDP-glucose pyrophosphorylase
MEKEKIKSFFIDGNFTIKQAMDRLTTKGIKILLVVNKDRKLNGTLTDGDIRRGIAKGFDLQKKVSDVMAINFFSISQKDNNRDQKARELMQKHHIEFAPILDESGRVVDIMTWYDALAEDKNVNPAPSIRNNPVVIMAGGKGTRLDPFTKILPKPLIPLGEKPIVEIIMDRFSKKGFNEFKLVVNHKKEMIKLYFKENTLPYKLDLIEESDYLGTVGGLALLKEQLKKTFILTNCDTLLDGDYSDFITWHNDNRNLLTIIGSHKVINVPYGVLQMEDGNLKEMIEKPNYDLFVNTGSYIMHPEVLEFLETNQRMDIDQLIIKLQNHDPNCVGVFPSWDGWSDVGQWEEYKNTLKSVGL